jgi:sRNA-binding protein
LPKEAPALPPETQNSAAPPEPKPPKPYVERYKRARVLLVTRYPAIFSAARPLAIGIHERLREAFPEEELSSEDLRAFLQVWVRRKPYRAALERGDRRVNLDGSDAGPAHVDLRATVIEPV